MPVYFLGSAEGVAAEAAAIVAQRYPGLLVAGTRNGYFSEAETPAVVAAIAASGAKLLFAGLGSPRQEFGWPITFAKRAAEPGSASAARSTSSPGESRAPRNRSGGSVWSGSIA